MDRGGLRRSARQRGCDKLRRAGLVGLLRGGFRWLLLGLHLFRRLRLGLLLLGRRLGLGLLVLGCRLGLGLLVLGRRLGLGLLVLGRRLGLGLLVLGRRLGGLILLGLRRVLVRFELRSVLLTLGLGRSSPLPFEVSPLLVEDLLQGRPPEVFFLVRLLGFGGGVLFSGLFGRLLRRYGRLLLVLFFSGCLRFFLSVGWIAECFGLWLFAFLCEFLGLFGRFLGALFGGLSRLLRLFAGGLGVLLVGIVCRLGGGLYFRLLGLLG